MGCSLELSLFEGMNAQQRKVLEHEFATQGPLLVLAGAGTGKTATITRRLALELCRGVSPQELTALTFTRKAALEMKERTEHLLHGQFEVPEIRTFHSLGLQILSENNGEAWKIAGWHQTPRLLDERDAQIWRANFWKGYFRHHSDTPPSARAFDKLMADWGTAEQLAQAQPDHPWIDLWQAWETSKRSDHVAMFSDLVSAALTALQRCTQLAAAWRTKSKTLLVDEYQDTDRTQYRLVQFLSKDSPRLLAVGDDDQSIYGFRGADVRNVLHWAQDHPNGQILSLTENYRCRAPILDVSNKIFPDKPSEYRKILVPGRNPSEGPRPAWRWCRDEEEERQWVRARIGSLLRQGIESHDICLLFRANRSEPLFRNALHDYPQSPDGTGEGIRFLTVHAAKGLEWPSVFVVEQDAPQSDRVQLLAADQDEERRLFYVACTRARDRLFLSSCKQRSRFNTPIPHTPLPWIPLVTPALSCSPSLLERAVGWLSKDAREHSIRRDPTP